MAILKKLARTSTGESDVLPLNGFAHKLMFLHKNFRPLPKKCLADPMLPTEFPRCQNELLEK